MFKTVREAELEIENAELKRRLYEAGDRGGPRDPSAIMFGSTPVKEMVVPAIQESIRLPIVASMYQTFDRGARRVVAKTHLKDGVVGYGYYDADWERLKLDEALQALGFMHERFTMELGKFLHDQRGKE